jgi:hypothetical protein
VPVPSHRPSTLRSRGLHSLGVQGSQRQLAALQVKNRRLRFSRRRTKLHGERQECVGKLCRGAGCGWSRKVGSTCGPPRRTIPPFRHRPQPRTTIGQGNKAYQLRVLHPSRFRFGRWSGWTVPCFWKAADLHKTASNQQYLYGPASHALMIFFMLKKTKRDAAQDPAAKRPARPQKGCFSRTP